jgi:hypothetical protein
MSVANPSPDILLADYPLSPAIRAALVALRETDTSHVPDWEARKIDAVDALCVLLRAA